MSHDGNVQDVEGEDDSVSELSADAGCKTVGDGKQERELSARELEARTAQRLYLRTDLGAGESTSASSELSSGGSGSPNSRGDGPRMDAATGLEESEYQHLDRYGFIHVPLASISPSPHNHHQHHDAAGGELSVHGNSRLDSPLEHYQRANEKEASRSMKWMNMLNEALDVEPDVGRWPVAHRKFLRRLAKGVPDSVRGRVWPRLSRRSLPSPNTSNSSSSNNNNNQTSRLDYKSLYLKISGYERQIDLDIERTLRDHVMFKIRFSQAQVSLFKMLVAYSNYDPVVGYCQGMSTVAAFLLLYFMEEEAFEMLVQILQREKLRTLYTTGFPLLFESFHLQEQLMAHFTPGVLKRLEAFGISPSVYATKWYLTLYLGFPFRIATRIWDLFLFHGRRMLVVIAVALLKCIEREVLEGEYETCLQLLSRLPDNALALRHLVNENRLIKMASQYWENLEGSDIFVRAAREHEQLQLQRQQRPQQSSSNSKRSS